MALSLTTTTTTMDTSDNDEPFLDTVEGEVHLFHAIARARPIGINAHFHLLHIWLAIQKETQQHITIDDLWTKLRSLYDIDALNAIVSCPVKHTQRSLASPGPRVN